MNCEQTLTISFNDESTMLSSMLNQTAVCLESLITVIARKGSALVYCHVIIVISWASKSFTTCFTPIPEVTQEQVIVALETIFSAKCFVTSLVMVFFCVVIEHSKHLVFTFACSYFPTSSWSRLVRESPKKKFFFFKLLLFSTESCNCKRISVVILLVHALYATGVFYQESS